MFKGKGRTVILGGLGKDVDTDGLRRLFAEIGGITYATVWTDSESGLSKGAGKVEFESNDLAQRAVEALRKFSPTAASIPFATCFCDGDTSSIDIHYDKVVSWLLARHVLKEDWHTALDGIHAKASLAMKDVPANDLDYFQVQEFCKLLSKSADSTEEKALKQVLELYKQSNAHLAEAAGSLMQTLRFDIPRATSQAQSCQKQEQEIERRQKDLRTRETEVKRKFREMCDARQIKGVDFQAELQDYISSALPKRLDNAVSLITSSCKEPLRFYNDFSKALGEDSNNGGDNMPLLRFVAANGNALLKDAADVNDQLKAEFKRVQDPKSVNVLANTVARGLVVDELMELDTFLAERCWELEEVESGRLTQNTNVKVEFNLEQTKAFHSKVAEAVEALCGKDVQPLLLLSSSESALRHAVSELAAQKALCEKPSKESATLDQRKAELSAEADLHSEESKRLRAQAQKLKGWLEEEMTRVLKYKVHVVGDSCP